VEAVCPGLEWRGEIAVVQAGRFVTFYKQVRKPSVVSKVVSKWVIWSRVLRMPLTTFVQVRLRVQVQRRGGGSTPHESQGHPLTYRTPYVPELRVLSLPFGTRLTLRRVDHHRCISRVCHLLPHIFHRFFVSTHLQLVSYLIPP
jgi:hypothetical protein